MTPAELDDALDAMEAAAVGKADQAPGLITVHTDHWINVLGAINAKAATLQDGLRHREIKVEVGSKNVTALLTRAEAGGRGAPYRELSPRP